MRISDWSSDVCSSDLLVLGQLLLEELHARAVRLLRRLEVQQAEDAVVEVHRGAVVRARPLRFAVCDPLADVLVPAIGRASCRERGCQYVLISVVAASLKTN